MSEDVGEAEGWEDEEAFLPVMVFQSDILMLCEPMYRGTVEKMIAGLSLQRQELYANMVGYTCLQ